MTAAELNERALSELGASNLVGAREALKEQLVGLLEALDRHDQGAEQVNLGDTRQVDNIIYGIVGELEGLLAVAVPLVEYGGEAGQEAVVTTLTRLAQEIDRPSQTPGWEQALFALVARLLWVTAAFALACDAVEFLPSLRRITVRTIYDNRDESLLAESRARYLAGYDGDADDSFEAHHRWIAELALVSERYPLLARDDELVKALMDADVLFAMYAVATGGHDDPYSHGARQGSGPAEKRIRARTRDPRQRPALAAFFGVGEAELEARMAAFYGSLRRQQGMWADEQPLFPLEGEEPNGPRGGGRLSLISHLFRAESQR